MEPIRRNTLVNQVMDRMKELIATGIYSPGDRIPTEAELAAQFGVGRSSIREAVKIFNYLGILESKSALGTFICERSNISREALTWALLLGKDDLNMLIEVRGAIELWSFLKVTALCGQNPEASAPVTEELQNILKCMERAIRDNDREAVIQADYDFHRRIIEGSGNPLFLELYEVLRSFLMNEIKVSQTKYEDKRGVLKEHRALFKALTSGNILTAESIFKGHIENIKSLIKNGKPSRKF